VHSLFITISNNNGNLNAVVDKALPEKYTEDPKLSKITESLFKLYANTVKAGVKEKFAEWLKTANINDYLVIQTRGGHRLTFLLKAGTVGVGTSLIVQSKTVTEVELKKYNKNNASSERITQDEAYDDDDDDDNAEADEDEEEGELEI